MPTIVTLYTKLDCPLCDTAKHMLQELQEEIPFELIEVDIYQNEELLEMYHLKIPVVVINGEEVAYGKIPKKTVRNRLLLE